MIKRFNAPNFVNEISLTLNPEKKTRIYFHARNINVIANACVKFN